MRVTMPDSTDTHPSFRHLVDIEDGLPGGQRLADARRHVDAGCSACTRRLRRVRRTIRAFRGGPVERPPSRLDRVAGRLLREAGYVEPRVPDAVEAWRVADTGAMPLAGVRSAAGATRRLLYAAGDVEVDLEIVARPGGFDVHGQVLDPDPSADVSGEVVGGGARGVIAADGRFVLRDLAPGGVGLTVRTARRAIVVRGLLLE